MEVLPSLDSCVSNCSFVLVGFSEVLGDFSFFLSSSSVLAYEVDLLTKSQKGSGAQGAAFTPPPRQKKELR